MWPGVKSWGWRNSVAHVAEALLPCWSWFHETNATTNCGFYVMDDFKEPHPWGKQLMDRMGCKVKHTNFGHKWKNQILNEFENIQVWREFPFQEGYWFESRSEIESLKRLVLPNESLEIHDKDMWSLQVGIVNRTGTRQIESLTGIRNGIEDALKPRVSTSISIQNLDNLTLEEQAQWFATKHIIVAAHGAGLTNCVFIQPKTTVISLYPMDFYFFGYFESLIDKTGGINMDWYAGDKATARDVHKEMSITEREIAKRVISFDPPAQDIVSLVVEASERYIDDVRRYSESSLT
jgi:hypothetical protein